MLDDTDRRLVEALRREARLPNKDLAARVGLAESSCLARVRRLVEERVLRGFHADVDFASLDRPLESVLRVEVRAPSRDRLQSLRLYAHSLPGVFTSYYVSGSRPLEIHVAVANAAELASLNESLATRDEVASIESFVIYDRELL